jgi:hypothetical protein
MLITKLNNDYIKIMIKNGYINNHYIRMFGYLSSDCRKIYTNVIKSYIDVIMRADPLYRIIRY